MSVRKKNSLFPFYLFGALILVIAAWTVYWVWMAGELKSGVENWVDEQRRAGLTINYTDMKMSGYPFRFVLDTDNPEIATPAGFSWQGERLRLIAQSYNLYHIIGFAPGENVFNHSNGDEIKLTIDEASAGSITFFSDWTPKSFRLSLERAEAGLNNKEIAAIEQLNLGLRPMPKANDNLQLAFDVSNARFEDLPPNLRWLGDMSELIIWLEYEKFYPILRGDLTETGWRVDDNKLHLRRGEALWGPLDLAARASVTWDRSGHPDGTIGIHLDSIDTLKESLEEAGLMTEGLNSALALIARTSAEDKFLTVAVSDRTFSFMGQELGRY